MTATSTSSAEQETSTAFQITNTTLSSAVRGPANVQEMLSLAVGYAVLTVFLLIIASRGPSARYTTTRRRAVPLHGTRLCGVARSLCTALTVFLLILVVISFIRFHRARETQNRQRLEAIADQLEKERLSAAALEARRSGQATVADERRAIPADFSCQMMSSVATTSSYVPAYLDVFLSFSDTSPVRDIHWVTAGASTPYKRWSKCTMKK